jgi:hypothetical protein
MVLRTTTNHENNLEKEVSWSERQVDEGRSILARLERGYEWAHIDPELATLLQAKTNGNLIAPKLDWS